MNVLIAHNPRGYLHAIVPDRNPDSTATFRQLQQRQGCTVTSMTSEEFRAWMQGQTAAAAAVDEPAPQAPEIESTPDSVQAADDPATGRGAPAVGAELVHPLIGWSTVTHHVTLHGQQLAVATGPKGSALVHDWRPAAPTDLPRWLRPAPDLAPVSAPASTAVDTPKASRMPSLFDLGVSA